MKLSARLAPLAILALCLVGCASAQNITIGYPPDRFVVAPNSSLIVQVNRPVRMPSHPFLPLTCTQRSLHLFAELAHRLTGGCHRHLSRALRIVGRAPLPGPDAATRAHALRWTLRPAIPPVPHAARCATAEFHGDRACDDAERHSSADCHAYESCRGECLSKKALFLIHAFTLHLRFSEAPLCDRSLLTGYFLMTGRAVPVARVQECHARCAAAVISLNAHSRLTPCVSFFASFDWHSGSCGLG